MEISSTAKGTNLKQFMSRDEVKNLPSLIVSKNGTSGVDAVSGATYSSHAIFNAVNDALSKAKKTVLLRKRKKRQQRRRRKRRQQKRKRKRPQKKGRDNDRKERGNDYREKEETTENPDEGKTTKMEHTK